VIWLSAQVFADAALMPFDILSTHGGRRLSLYLIRILILRTLKISIRERRAMFAKMLRSFI
jgi:hypothetical protein